MSDFSKLTVTVAIPHVHLRMHITTHVLPEGIHIETTHLHGFLHLSCTICIYSQFRAVKQDTSGMTPLSETNIMTIFSTESVGKYLVAAPCM